MSEPPQNISPGEPKRCAKCGMQLPIEQLLGHCPECLLELGLSAQAETLSEDGEFVGKPMEVDAVPGMVIGRYKLLEQIGAGGFGLVFMTEQTEPVCRKVALKVIKAGMDTREVIARFEAERQALALMDHPNIAKVFDAGATESGRPYFVMELVNGLAVTDYCDRECLTTEQRLHLFMQICHGVEHAHQKGIIHRDLKPKNILVTVVDGHPVPKIIDFGVAKALGHKLTERTLATAVQQIIGTPAYMSPEQAELSGVDVDTRSDIYSLGVVLYELLTGAAPFDKDTFRRAALDEVRRIIREVEPPKPSTRLKTLGPKLAAVAKSHKTDPTKLPQELEGDLDCIIMQCLEKERSRRYNTATALAQDLERQLTNQPVLARPPSLGYRANKFLRRNRALTLTASLITITLLLGVIISTWQAFRATRAESEEKRQRQIAQAETTKAREAEAAEKQQRQRAMDGEAYARSLLYAANMNLVEKEWEQNNIARVHELLQETFSYPDRGFEWYYWQRQINLGCRIILPHAAEITCLAVSSDGRRIVTGSDKVTVWDAVTGKELLSMKWYGQGATSVAYSPDGKLIVAGTASGYARVWDALTGDLLHILKPATRLCVDSLTFSADSRHIGIGQYTGFASIWDYESGREVVILRESSPGGITGITNAIGGITFRGINIASVCFSPNGRRIVTSSPDPVVRVWDSATGEEVLSLKGHTKPVTSAAFSPDGKQIVTGSHDNTVKMWEADSGREIRTLTGHDDYVCSALFTAGGNRIITSSADQTIRVWDAATGIQLGIHREQGTKGQSTLIAVSPDGEWFVSSSGGATARVWDWPRDDRPLGLAGHTVAFSPDGKRLLTSSRDMTAKLWEASTGKELLTLKGHTNSVSSAAFSPDGQQIITCGSDMMVLVWDSEAGAELRTQRRYFPNSRSIRILNGAFAVLVACKLLPRGEYSDLTFDVIDLAKGTSRIKGAGWPIALSPDAELIVEGHAGKVREIATGKDILDTGALSCAAFTPDGRLLVGGRGGHTAKVWDVKARIELVTFAGVTGTLTCAVFSPDGRRVACGSSEGTAKLWDVQTGRELLTLEGAPDAVSCIAFSPDGRRIAVARFNSTVEVWEAASWEDAAGWKGRDEAIRDRLASINQPHSEPQVPADSWISDWFILAPIPCSGTNGEVALDQEQIPEEATLLPPPPLGGNYHVFPDLSRLYWKRHEGYLSGLIDFLEHSTRTADWSVAYAVSCIQSPTNYTGLSLKIGSDDQAKIYLNGKQVYRNGKRRLYAPGQDVVNGVELKAGLNVLVFKVVNETGEWQGSVSLTDAAGQPVNGISASNPYATTK